ncbi:MAG TPA: Fic family protein [Patescibacteria group bacterium]|jgi:Fic family protein|nr:Fic family protein [Patescibacteria group bacterium]
MNYSGQLKAILQASGWSQEELARRLGVSFVTLNAWVNARANPRKKATEDIRLLYFEVLGSDSLDIGALEELIDKVKYLKTTVQEVIDNEEVLNRLILNLTYHTNTIEGSTMTLDDTKEVLFNNKILTNRTQVEQAEARNHKAALLWILDELEKKDFVISEDLIKGLNLRLMNGIITNAGQYRNHSVRIMGTHVTVSNFLRVPELMEELIDNLKKPSKDLIALMSTTHATFERIHPFSDGNGRVGRLLMLAQALQAGFVPPIVLKERKYAYYKYLELAQTNDNSMPLQIFVAESMITADELLFDS